MAASNRIMGRNRPEVKRRIAGNASRNPASATKSAPKDVAFEAEPNPLAPFPAREGGRRKKSVMFLIVNLVMFPGAGPSTAAISTATDVKARR